MNSRLPLADNTPKEPVLAGSFGVRAVALLAAISALDGFAVLSVAFAAPGFSRAFGANAAAQGWTLATGLVGMGLGSLLLAPLADRYGRKSLVQVNLALMLLGMAASAAATGYAGLIVARLVTGLGTGAMIAVLAPLAADHASPRRRELAIGLMSIGYPVGGVLGGTVSALLLQGPGWRAIFVLGSVLAAVLWALIRTCLYEPAGSAEDRRPEEPRRPVPMQADTLPQAAKVTAINVLFVTSGYFFLNWVPLMVVGAGHSPAQATSVSVVANLSGVAGGVLLGWLAPRFGLQRLAAFALVGSGCGTALFGSVLDNLGTALLVAAVTGFFVFGGFVGMFALIAASFPPRVRTTGAGWVIGIGRGGSVLATLGAGMLFDAGMDRADVSVWLGSCAVVAGVALARLRWRPLT